MSYDMASQDLRFAQALIQLIDAGTEESARVQGIQRMALKNSVLRLLSSAYKHYFNALLKEYKLEPQSHTSLSSLYAYCASTLEEIEALHAGRTLLQQELKELEREGSVLRNIRVSESTLSQPKSRKDEKETPDYMIAVSSSEGLHWSEWSFDDLRVSIESLKARISARAQQGAEY